MWIVEISKCGFWHYNILDINKIIKSDLHAHGLVLSFNIWWHFKCDYCDLLALFSTFLQEKVWFLIKSLPDASTIVENWVLLKPVLGGVRDVALIHYPHAQTQSNQVCNFHVIFVVINASEGSICFQIFSHR
jgi:hypothetical protein